MLTESGKNGRWNDCNCYTKYAFICRKPKGNLIFFAFVLNVFQYNAVSLTKLLLYTHCKEAQRNVYVTMELTRCDILPIFTTDVVVGHRRVAHRETRLTILRHMVKSTNCPPKDM